MSEKSFHCELLTAEGGVWTGKVSAAVLPATDGQLAILAHRLPVLVAMGGGALRLTLSDGGEAMYYVFGGTGRMENDHLTILAEECVSVSQLDPHEVWEELSDANALPHKTDDERTIRDSRVIALREKFKLAQAHGGRRGSKR
jgi:F-type H+-transporting ATPase subunit epsilon